MTFEDMITKRKLKLLWRSNSFKMSIGMLALIFLALLILKDSNTHAPEPGKQVKDYDFNDIETDTSRFLIVLIMTGPSNVNRRNIIRETWLSRDALVSIENDVRHYFVIGINNLSSKVHNSLILEQNLHQDLLFLENFQDAYDKLTEKLGRMIEWLDNNIKHQYVLKADDDTFVRLDQIVNDLKSDVTKRDAKNLYWGYFYGKGHVKQSGPWKETNWRLCDYYLPYARGGGYVLSSDLVKYVSKNWHQFELYLSEDVSLGAWLAPLRLTRVHDVRFDTEYKSRGCKNLFIVSHKQSIDEMTEKYNNLKTTRKLCAKENTKFAGYIYNWNVPPSQCCVRKESVP